MPDAYNTNLKDHLADCYQARGLSPAGSEQLANNQTPAKPSDQAMIGTKTTVLPPICIEKNLQVPCKSGAQTPSAQAAAPGQAQTAVSGQGAAGGQAAVSGQTPVSNQAAVSGGNNASGGGNTQGGDKTYDKWVNKSLNW